MSRRVPRPGPIYAIADAEALGTTPLPVAVAEIAAAGIGWIQVRAKKLSGAELYRVLEACCRALEGSAPEGTALWIDDRVDLAALFPVAGVHLGQADLPPAAARKVVNGVNGVKVAGSGLWIGASTHDAEQLAAAERDPDVDVIAVGPVFPTTGKERPDPVVGLEFVRAARRVTNRPLVAIGGIDAGNVAAVLEAGADTAAVLGAICRGDVSANCRRLQAALAAVA